MNIEITDFAAERINEECTFSRDFIYYAAIARLADILDVIIWDTEIRLVGRDSERNIQWALAADRAEDLITLHDPTKAFEVIGRWDYNTAVQAPMHIIKQLLGK